MINLLPPRDRHINYRGRIDRSLIKEANCDLLRYAYREAAENVIREIISRFIKEVPPKHPLEDCVTFEISAFVLTQEEYEDAVTRAYIEGKRDAYRGKNG